MSNNIWFLAENPRATFLVVHGLNLRPETMNPLCEFLNSCGFHVLRAGLTAHDGGVEEKHLSSFATWRQEVSAAYQEMQARFPEYDRGILGYSLGGTLTIDLLYGSSDINPRALILLAPAVCIQPYFNLARPLLFLRHFRCSLISLIPKPYYAQRFTPVSMYAAALQAFDSVRAISDLPGRTQALVLCSPNDGLVDFSALKNWIARNKLVNWKVAALETAAAGFRNFNHLIIDQNGMGDTSWRKMTKIMREYLDSFFPHQDSSAAPASAPLKD